MSVFDLVERKEATLHRQAGDANGVGRIGLVAGWAGSVDHQEAEAADGLGFYHLAAQVLEERRRCRCCVGDMVGGDDGHHILGAPPHEAVRAGVGRRRCAVGRGCAALHAGIHVGAVIIADIEDVLVACRCAGKRLQTDVESAAVAGHNDHLRGRPALPVERRADAGGGSGRRRKDGVYYVGAQLVEGISTGNNGKTRGRHYVDGIFSQNARQVAGQQSPATAAAAQGAGIHLFVFYQIIHCWFHNRWIVLFHVISCSFACRMAAFTHPPNSLAPLLFSPFQ